MDSGGDSHVLGPINVGANLSDLDWHSVALAVRIEYDNLGSTASGVFREDVKVRRSVDNNPFWLKSGARSGYFRRVSSKSFDFDLERRLRDVAFIEANL